MNLNALAKLTLFGLIYVYSVKMIDTLWNGIFSHLALAGTVVGLNILAGLAQLCFFIAFQKQLAPEDKAKLRIAACLAIVGSAVAILPKLLAMATLFQIETAQLLVSRGAQIGAYCPWVASLLLLIFSLLFLFDSATKRNMVLKRAYVAGAIGWLTMAGVQTLVMINYVTAGRLVWLADLFTAGPIVFVTASSLTLLGLVVFYLSFARQPIVKVYDDPINTTLLE